MIITMATTSKRVLLALALFAVTFHYGSADANIDAPVHHGDHHQQQELAGPLVATSEESTPKVPTNALQCYQCNTIDDSGCDKNETLKEKYLQPCALNQEGQTAIGCWVLRQTVEYDQNPDLHKHSRTVRKCAYIGQDVNCISRAGFGGSISHCYCNTTRCNNSTGIRSNPLMVLLSTAVFLGLFAKWHLG